MPRQCYGCGAIVADMWEGCFDSELEKQRRRAKKVKTLNKGGQLMQRMKKEREVKRMKKETY